MFDVFYINKPTGIWPHEKKVSSIKEACALSRTRYLWIVDGNNDYSQFDWLWEPSPWQAHQTHVWPSQHQENGGTYLVPRTGVDDINRSHSIVPRKTGPAIVGIDHGDGLDGVTCNYQTRYVNDYLGTLRRILSKVKKEHAWVVSSVCNYSGFDFTWHPSEWQQDMLHVFPSHDQKFGDTFYVHIPSFLEKTKNLKLLEWFETIHFVENVSVPRWRMPVVQHEYDSQVDAIRAHKWEGPVALFTNHKYADGSQATVNLWREETKQIIPLSPGASTVIVPQTAAGYIKKQLYDYPYIDRTHYMLKDQPLDIVFISNGENEADYLYQWLIDSVGSDSNNNNTIKRVDNVKGRVAAYQAAAHASETPWFFAVFGKLQVEFNFNWNWQPDRMQQPKHYIFHARNPINELVYGHQAMIAYNKKLVLKNTGQGLDFTLDQPHEVVPILSGTANYYTSNWMCWRTAFREVLKLRASLPDVENEYRLKQWLTVDTGAGEWSSKGAADAVEYYEEVKGNFDALKKSYEWDWLASYAFIKRNLVPQ